MKLYIAILSLLLGVSLSTTASVDMYVLDSIVILDDSYNKINKEVYTYDQNKGYKTSTKGYLYSSGDWIENYEFTYQYDENNNLIAEEGSFLNSEISKIVSAYKYNFAYDSNNYYNSEEYQIKETGNTDWTGVSKYSYSYQNGKITEAISLVWDEQSLAWVNKEKYAYDYDGYGNQVLAEVYSFNKSNQQWQTLYKEEKEFNSNGLIISESYYSNNDASDGWKNTTKTVNTYSGSHILQKMIYSSVSGTDWVENINQVYTYSGDNLTNVESKMWNGSTNSWIKTNRNTYSYDSGKANTVKTELWNENSNKWVLSMEKYFSYPDGGIGETIYAYDPKGIKTGLTRNMEVRDSDGNILLNREHNWDTTSADWVLIGESVSEYNSSMLQWNEKYYTSDNGVVSGYFKAVYSYNLNEDITRETLYSWGKNQNDWKMERLTAYYYNDLSSVNEEINGNNNMIKIWTSPGKINITSEAVLSSVNVFSIQGKQVYKNSETSILSTQGWIPGTYIVSVKTENGLTKSAKVIVK